MGQRGHRKYRFRCQYVDPDTGLRCRVQVKRAGSKYCGREHAWAAQRGLPVAVQPLAAKGRYLAARKALRARVEVALRQLGLEGQRLADVMQITMETADARYRAGYTAGITTAGKRTRRLKLSTSKQVLSEFVGSKVGKVFTNGNIGHDALANFRFGLER